MHRRALTLPFSVRGARLQPSHRQGARLRIRDDQDEVSHASASRQLLPRRRLRVLASEFRSALFSSIALSRQRCRSVVVAEGSIMDRWIFI
jgi:hypothetical protein